jgi:hypothetical protein
MAIQIGQIFTHSVSRPWKGKDGTAGCEKVTYRSEVTYADDRRMEYRTVERLSVADPLPGTDGGHSEGGGMANFYFKSQIDSGNIKLEG